MLYTVIAASALIGAALGTFAGERLTRWHARREWQKREQKAKVEAEQMRIAIEAQARETLRAAELEWRRKVAN